MKLKGLRACAAVLFVAGAPLVCADGAQDTGKSSVYVVASQTTHDGIASFARDAQYRRNASGETLVIARVDTADIDAVSRYVHENERRCGGFFAFDSLDEAERFLADDRGAQAAAPPGVSYTIDNHATVDPWLPQVLDTNIHGTIKTLSAFRNRYYKSTYGKQAAESIRDMWLALAANRSDVDVELFTGCTDCSTQPSVIMTLHGKERADEVVVIGGHLDSISGTSNEQVAPGADDDASGIATITEIARIALASGWRPQRTIKFMGYAAEEVGLRGSNAVATKFANDGVDVVGVLQLDMTNYKNGAAYDMQRITDYTDASLNTWSGELFSAYLAPLGFVLSDFPCGYACSDHASWKAKGFPASMMFEAGEPRTPQNSFGDFPYIHSTGDTLANMGDSAIHSVKFAQFGLAFIGELGKTHDPATNQAPVAAFSYAAEGLQVQFSDASSDIDGVIATRQWDFGDGTTSTERDPLKTYAASGTYAVSLTTTDDDGAQSLHVEDVVVIDEIIFVDGFDA